jgi:hypothetical protein
MEREYNKIEKAVDIKQIVSVEITDDQLGRASAEAVEESPTNYVGHIGKEAVLQMAAVLYKEHPIEFMGDLVAIASNPTTVSHSHGSDLNLS